MMKTLVVEDNEDMRELVAEVLEERGHQVSAFERAEEAWEAFQGEEFLLAVLDWGLPGMSGLELCEKIRNHPSGEYCIVDIITGRSDSKDLEKALRAGANDYLVKPVTIDMMNVRFAVAERQVHNLLRRKQAEISLQKQQREAQVIFDSVPAMIWYKNNRNEILRANRAALEFIGLTASEAAGTSMSDIYPPDKADEYHQQDLKVINSGKAKFGIIDELETALGDKRWVNMDKIPYRDERGNIIGVIDFMLDITERKRAEDQLLYTAFYDKLTGLPNRALFLDRLRHTFQRWKRNPDQLFAVLFLDLDRFKVVNDSLGHHIGDKFLREVSRRLVTGLRESDSISRFGGDEFTVLLDEINDPSDAIRIAKRIQEALEEPFVLEGHEVYTSISIGIALSSTGYEKPEEFLRDADIALFRAKAVGKSRFEVFDSSMHARAMARLKLESDLRKSLRDEDFVLHYQPIISLKTNRIIGMEALIRWIHPEKGMISPLEFIPVAEETELIVPISWWIMEEACNQMKSWQDKFESYSNMWISINLSAGQFSQDDLLNQLSKILEHTALPRQCFKVEITETMLMKDLEAASETLTEIKELGIQIAIDDFGTGYSSLSYLHHFPLDTLKIDRSFVSKLGKEGENMEIIESIIKLTHSLKKEVIAEGIEQREQIYHLKGLNCDYGQGYYYSRPLDKYSMEELLSRDPQWGEGESP